MQPSVEAYLTERIAAGGFRIGQVQVTRDLRLCHVDDDPFHPELEKFCNPADARMLVLYDSKGKYRPLKTAPNLRKGWLLELRSVAELHQALDHIYPAALGLWLGWKNNHLHPAPWRETINRQTGMYRVVGKITDEQSADLIASTCNSRTGCLREILWPIEEGKPHPLTMPSPTAPLEQREASGEIPLLCREACNLLVAAGRKVVKGTTGQGE